MPQGEPETPPDPILQLPVSHRLVIVLLLLQLLHEDGFLLVLAPLVLEPDAYDPRAQAGHLHQLLLHERVGPRVSGVARPQSVQLLLVEHGPHAGCLLGLFVHVRTQRGLPARSRVCKGARDERVTATHSPCARPRGGRVLRGPISFLVYSIYFVLLFVFSPFPSVRPTRKKVCIFVPSLVPPQGSPRSDLASAQAGRGSSELGLCGTGVADPRCASSTYQTLGMPAWVPRDEGSSPEEVGVSEEEEGGAPGTLEGERGRGPTRTPSAALPRNWGACLPLPGGPQEPFSLIQRPLGQGQAVCLEDLPWGASGPPGPGTVPFCPPSGLGPPGLLPQGSRFPGPAAALPARAQPLALSSLGLGFSQPQVK